MDNCAFTGHKDVQYLITATIQVCADSPKLTLLVFPKTGANQTLYNQINTLFLYMLLFQVQL